MFPAIPCAIPFVIRNSYAEVELALRIALNVVACEIKKGYMPLMSGHDNHACSVGASKFEVRSRSESGVVAKTTGQHHYNVLMTLYCWRS